MALTQQEAFARIRLLRSPHVGPVTFRHMLARFGTAIAALEALPDLASRGGRRQTVVSVEKVNAEIAAVRDAGAKYLFHDDPAYPQPLSEISGAPPILTYRGDAALLARPAVAIIGARNASAAALKLARRFAEELAGDGRLVVSGLARGIDGAAHEGALATGATAGVIASGIDIAYPPQHAELQERVATDGLLLAEMPPGTEPQARHFPSRNRIIAGICAGTVVVEAAPKSGSLITARLAGEAGREVMAIPGSPMDGRARGCNQLIREGAILVQSAADVAELLDSFTGTPRSTFREDRPDFDWIESGDGPPPAEQEAADIVDLLSTAAVPVDDIVRASGASAASVQLALLELELAGRLTRHAGGRVSLIE